MTKSKKLSNFWTAKHVFERRSDLTDEQLITVSKKLGFYPKVFIKNYRFIERIENLFNELKEIDKL